VARTGHAAPALHYLRCVETSFVISNIVTSSLWKFLPPPAFYSALAPCSSALSCLSFTQCPLPCAILREAPLPRRPRGSAA
jgi:hypothetical protein